MATKPWGDHKQAAYSVTPGWDGDYQPCEGGHIDTSWRCGICHEPVCSGHMTSHYDQHTTGS